MTGLQDEVSSRGVRGVSGLNAGGVGGVPTGGNTRSVSDFGESALGTQFIWPPPYNHVSFEF